MAKGRRIRLLTSVPTIFVTGTDTGVGKTFVTAALVRALREAGVHAGAVKPFATGSRDDARVLRDAMDGELTLAEINPVFFRRPLSPMVAARLEGRRVPLRVCEARGKRQEASGLPLPTKRFDLLLVEGIGGWLVPLTPRVSVADWVARQGWPIIIVARAGLGTLNHTLLTVESAHQRGVEIAAVILNDAPASGTGFQPVSAVDEKSSDTGWKPVPRVLRTLTARRNAAVLRRLTRLPVFVSLRALAAFLAEGH